MNVKAYLEIFNMAITIGLTFAIPINYWKDGVFSTIDDLFLGVMALNWALLVTSNQMAKEFWERWRKK